MFSSCQSLLCFSFYGEVPGLALDLISPPLHSLLTTLPFIEPPHSSLDNGDQGDTGSVRENKSRFPSLRSETLG